MATNIIPMTYDPLVALAEDAADGAQQHEAAIGLLYQMCWQFGGTAQGAALLDSTGIEKELVLHHTESAIRTDRTPPTCKSPSSPTTPTATAPRAQP